MGMDNTNWQDLREEATELEHKLIELRRFINEGTRFLQMTAINQRLVHEQEDAMAQYHDILMQRLAN